jgi:hypothetical protein
MGEYEISQPVPASGKDGEGAAPDEAAVRQMRRISDPSRFAGRPRCHRDSSILARIATGIRTTGASFLQITLKCIHLLSDCKFAVRTALGDPSWTSNDSVYHTGLGGISGMKRNLLTLLILAPAIALNAQNLGGRVLFIYDEVNDQSAPYVRHFREAFAASGLPQSSHKYNLRLFHKSALGEAVGSADGEGDVNFFL